MENKYRLIAKSTIELVLIKAPKYGDDDGCFVRFWLNPKREYTVDLPSDFNAGNELLTELEHYLLTAPDFFSPDRVVADCVDQANKGKMQFDAETKEVREEMAKDLREMIDKKLSDDIWEELGISQTVKRSEHNIAPHYKYLLISKKGGFDPVKELDLTLHEALQFSKNKTLFTHKQIGEHLIWKHDGRLDEFLYIAKIID